MRGTWKIVCLVLAACLAAACGGPSDTPPTPLTHHFDEMYIAAIPLDQQGSVVETQNDWNKARMEEANAQTQVDEIATQLAIAQNDVKAAQLAIDSAMSQKKSADASADTNRINDAQRNLHTAEDLKKAAQTRVAYLRAYQGYIKRYFRYTQENMYWREAQFEEAKATLAKAHNIAPRGIVYDDFPKQLDARKNRTATAKDRAEGEKQKAAAARDSWIKDQKSADIENGHESSLWDPMVPKADAAPAAAETTTNTPANRPADATPAAAEGSASAGSAAGSGTAQ